MKKSRIRIACREELKGVDIKHGESALIESRACSAAGDTIWGKRNQHVPWDLGKYVIR